MVLRRRAFGFVLLAALAATLVAAPAAGARSPDDAIVVITGDVDVTPNQRVADVVVIDGDISVAGRVEGDVIAVAGDVRVRGRVEGDVVTVAGRLTALPGARIGGDVNYADERPVISPRATVAGEISEEGWDEVFGPLGLAALVGHLALWLAITVSTLILGGLLLVIAPQAADATRTAFGGRAGVAVAVGLGLFIGLPLVAVVAIATLLGLPLGLALLSALVPFWAVGYVAGAWLLGRRIVGPPRHRFVSFAAGWAILRAIALIPILGSLVSLAAVIVGLGALGLAIGDARRSEDEPGTGAPAPA
jgi:hypothetical protein